MSSPINAVLISTYELGRQPFGLASPAAWLRRAGASVECLDLSRQALSEKQVRGADFIAFYVPMHTATRLAVEALPRIRNLNPNAHLCFYGLYAPVNEAYLRALGATTVIGGEFEESLVAAVEKLRTQKPDPARPAPGEKTTSLARQKFLVPQRQGFPPLSRYAHVILPTGEHRIAGSTEASRGCKHWCRHCPVVPVYQGHFRVVQRDVVLQDIRQQVAAGAQHITFGDPDFFNGPRHATETVTALHREFPELTYDVTIKIEHLLKRRDLLGTLRETGCLFVTSAVESVDDAVLARLEKGHTFADFVQVVEIFRREHLVLSPTFVAFHPWTTFEGYCELLERIAELDLVEHVAPIQLAIRLLIPAGSRLLEVAEVREMVGEFDPQALFYPWANRDPRVDELGRQVLQCILTAGKRNEPRRAVFARVWKLANDAAGASAPAFAEPVAPFSRATVPYLNEPWYC